MSIQTCLMLCSKTLEHMKDHYVIFIVIGLFLAGKTSALTNHDTDDIMVCHTSSRVLFNRILIASYE